MPKGFRTINLIQGKEPLLRRSVCGVGYQDGQLYLDHCGRLLKRLLGETPDWILAPEPTPQGTTLYNLRTGTQLGFSVSAASLSLDKSAADETIEADEFNEFLGQVDSTLALVFDELEVSRFTRVGYREFYYFSFGTKEESETWLRELGLVTVAPSLYQAFAGTPDVLSMAIVLQGEECRYRIALNGIERPAQIPFGQTILGVKASATAKNQKQVLLETLRKARQRQVNSAFAVELDIDAFLLDPESFELRDFVQQHATGNLQRFRESLSKKDPAKKGK